MVRITAAPCRAARLTPWQGLLTDVGLEQFLDKFSDIGIVSVTDLRRVFERDPAALDAIGLRKVQLARLKQALERPRSPAAHRESFKVGTADRAASWVRFMSVLVQELKEAAAKGIKL
jgi:hypothetical protein